MARRPVKGPIAHSCGGKFRYPNAATARKQVYKVLREGDAAAKKLLNAYRCKDCGGWHVGHRSAT